MYQRTSSRNLGYPSVTATARVIDNLALYGHTPGQDEVESRPLPDDDQLAAIADGLYTAISGPLTDTGLEPHVEDLLWSLTNALQFKVDRAQRQLDDNEAKQREALEQYDGSEITTVELERLVEQGRYLQACRDAFETLRDRGCTLFEETTGSIWRPRTGKSSVNHRTMTAAAVDSREYIAAKRYRETTVLLPEGPKVAFTGGQDFKDHKLVFAALDKAHATYPDMVLLHTGSASGADALAARWARARKVPEIAFKPDWNRYNKSAPFKRNDLLLQQAPVGLLVFPGNGITDNLADKAKAAGFPVADYRKR